MVHTDDLWWLTSMCTDNCCVLDAVSGGCCMGPTVRCAALFPNTLIGIPLAWRAAAMSDVAWHWPTTSRTAQLRVAAGRGGQEAQDMKPLSTSHGQKTWCAHGNTSLLTGCKGVVLPNGPLDLRVAHPGIAIVNCDRCRNAVCRPSLASGMKPLCVLRERKLRDLVKLLPMM